MPYQRGFIVRLNADASPNHQRFTLAHEIGHTFFYDLSAMPPRHDQTTAMPFWREEGICNLIAEELLLPDWAVATELDKVTRPSIGALVNLANTFAVSVELLVRRLHRLHSWPATFVLWYPKRSKNQLQILGKRTKGRGRDALPTMQDLLAAWTSGSRMLVAVDSADDPNTYSFCDIAAFAGSVVVGVMPNNLTVEEQRHLRTLAGRQLTMFG